MNIEQEEGNRLNDDGGMMEEGEHRGEITPCPVLGIFNLSSYTTEASLETLFGEFGQVDSVRVIFDKETGRSKRYGFVKFVRLEDAQAAKEKTSGMEFEGRIIRVDYSITQRPHSPTPGRYLGHKMTRRPRSRSPRRRGRYPSPMAWGGSRRPYSRRSPSPRYQRRQYEQSPRYGGSHRRSPSPERYGGGYGGRGRKSPPREYRRDGSPYYKGSPEPRPYGGGYQQR